MSYFNVNNLINISNDGSFNIEFGDLPSSSNPIDFGVLVQSNLFYGNYSQDSNFCDANISSNFLLDTNTFSTSTFILIPKEHLENETGLLTNDQTLYNIIEDDNISVNANSYYGKAWFPSERPVFVNKIYYLLKGSFNNDVYGDHDLGEVWSEAIDSRAAGFGAVLVESTAAALFKQFGGNFTRTKNYINIFNYATQVTSDIGNSFTETNANFNDSPFFREYINTNRYIELNNGQVDPPTDYNLEGFKFQWIMKIQGSVNPSSSINYERTFGNYQNGDTKVDENGDFMK